MMIYSLLRILALARKELLAVVKDPRSRASLFIPPILQCLIYGYAATYDLDRVPYAVLDQDHSAASRDLLARLNGSKVFDRVANLESPAEAADYINERRTLLVLEIDGNFTRQLYHGDSATLQVIADGRNSNTVATAMAYIGSIVDQFNADWQKERGINGPPLQVTTRAWYNPNLETRWYMIPALIGTLTLMQTLMLTALSVAREREEGTFDQLLVTPCRPGEIMVGKALPSMLVGTAQATSVLLVAQFWFEIPFAGSYLTLYAGLVLFLMAAVGIGLLVSSVSATMQQAMLFSFTLIMPFALLSGLTTPVGNMPQILQYVTMINPLRYAIDIAQRVYLEGAGMRELMPELWPLAVIGAITLAMASWMFRNRLT
jgi:ABC-2 type transport system permease protein